METISIRFRARAARRNVVAAFREWARLARREDEAMAFAAERVALATRVAAERHAARRARRVARSFVRAWRVATTARRDARGGSRRTRRRETQNSSPSVATSRRRRRERARASRARRGSSLARRGFDGDAPSGRRRTRGDARGDATIVARVSALARRDGARVVDDARRRAASAEASVQTLGAEVASLGRVAAADRAAAEEASSREKATLVALASAERVASAAAPRGGSLLESPLAWRSLETENDASVPALVASTSLPDPTPPVFLPDVDPDAYRPVDDGAPPSAGDVVVIFAGASESMVAATLRLETRGADDPSKESAWTLEPTARWTPLGPGEVAGKAPPPRQNPATCALPAATAATAAAAGGADPGGVVGGVFVFGGHDGEDETNDAHVLIRRTREEGSEEGSEGGSEGSEGSSRGNTPRPAPEWEWVRLPNAPFSPAPPRRSHAAAFAAPTPLVGSPAASSSETRVDVYVMGGYRSGAEAGGVRNDLWRLDAATLTWSSPETFGDVPAPRRDAAIATTCASASGAGRVFVHGGRAADGEALADCHVLDIADMTWTRLPPDAYADADVVGGRPGDGDFSRGSTASPPRWPRSIRGQTRLPLARFLASRIHRRGRTTPRRSSVRRFWCTAATLLAPTTRLARSISRRCRGARFASRATTRRGKRAGRTRVRPGIGVLATRCSRTCRVSFWCAAARRGRRSRRPRRTSWNSRERAKVDDDARRRRRRRGRSRRARGPSETRRRGRGRRSRRDATRPRRRRRAERRGGRRRARRGGGEARGENPTRKVSPREKTRGGRRGEKENALANAESAAARSDVAWVKIEAHAREARDARRARDVAVEEARDAREDAAVAAEAVARFLDVNATPPSRRKRRRPRPRRARTRSRWKS